MQKTPILSAVDLEALWYCYTIRVQVQALIDALDIHGIKEGNLKNSLLSHVQIIAHEMNNRLECNEAEKIAYMSKTFLLLETKFSLIVDETGEEDEDSVNSRKDSTLKESPKKKKMILGY